VAAPLPFPTWVERATAKKAPAGPVPWATYCRSLDDTGIIYHDAVLVLRDYGHAIESLSDAKDFDGSGLQKAGDGAGTVASTLLHAPGVTGAASGIGSAASTAAGVILGLVRVHELRKLIHDGAPAAGRVVTALEAYMDALETERVLVASHRNNVLKAIDARRDGSGAFLPSAEGAIAYDLSRQGAVRLAATERRIAADKELLRKIGRALATLANASDNSDAECAARDEAAALERAVDDLRRQRPEEH
jgi:hypothetical protein